MDGLVIGSTSAITLFGLAGLNHGQRFRPVTLCYQFHTLQEITNLRICGRHRRSSWLWLRNGLQPTRLLGPWDFPGKSTGVGCHCLLPYLFTSLPKSLTSSHLWDANAHPPLAGPRGEKTLTTGGPGKEQGTNKFPPTRILQRSTRGQQEMGDCSPEVLATSSEQQRPSIV